MPTTITGNPTGVVAPMVTPPTPNQVPVITAPVDGEAGSAGSLSSFEQQTMNHLAMLMQQAVWNATFPTTSSNLPQMRFKDAAGNGRWVVDHNGLPTGGRVSVVDEEWCVSPGSSASVWAVAGTTGGSATSANPVASYGARSVVLTPSSTATTGIYNTSGSKLFMSNSSWLTAVIEFEMGLNAAAIGNTSNVDFYVGLGTQGDASTDTNQFAIAKLHTQTNYQFISSSAGGLPQVHDTGIPPTANPNNIPIDRIRIELYGSASIYGQYTVRIFINEAATTILPANISASFLPVIACANTGGAPSGSPLAYVGPVKICWNRFLSGPNL